MILSDTDDKTQRQGEQVCQMVQYILRMSGAPMETRLSVLVNLIADELLAAGLTSEHWDVATLEISTHLKQCCEIKAQQARPN